MGIDHLLNATVEVWRLTPAPDGQGGWTENYAYHHDERVRISSPSARERETAAQMGVDLAYIGYGKNDADVVRQDQLRGDGISRFVSTDEVLEVIGREPPSVNHHLKWRLRTEKLRRPG